MRENMAQFMFTLDSGKLTTAEKEDIDPSLRDLKAMKTEKERVN